MTNEFKTRQSTRDSNTQYRIANKEYFASYQLNYNLDPARRLGKNIRQRLYEFRKKMLFSNIIIGCARELDYFGCTLRELRAHLLAGFKALYGYEAKEDMDVVIDHLVPLGSAMTVDGALQLNHFTNLRLVLKKDNFLKMQKDRAYIKHLRSDRPRKARTAQKQDQ